MMSTWNEDPTARPTFQQVLKELNSISPTQGDLMDNLVRIVCLCVCACVCVGVCTVHVREKVYKTFILMDGFICSHLQLEKYSTNLEAVVAERTTELAAEKTED